MTYYLLEMARAYVEQGKKVIYVSLESQNNEKEMK